MFEDRHDKLRVRLAAGDLAPVLDALAKALGHRRTGPLAQHRRTVLLLRSTVSDIERRRSLGMGRPDDGQQTLRVTSAVLDLIDDLERGGVEIDIPEPPAARTTLSAGANRAVPAAIDGEDEAIFLSYSHLDGERAGPIIAVLKARGWSVFWDPQIVPGIANWDRYLERKLEAARCIVVLWSKAAAVSEYVRIEAHQGRNRGILVATTLDGTIPATFALVQTQDLTGWAGDAADPRIGRMCEGVARLLG